MAGPLDSCQNDGQAKTDERCVLRGTYTVASVPPPVRSGNGWAPAGLRPDSPRLQSACHSAYFEHLRVEPQHRNPPPLPRGNALSRVRPLQPSVVWATCLLPVCYKYHTLEIPTVSASKRAVCVWFVSMCGILSNTAST